MKEKQEKPVHGNFEKDLEKLEQIVQNLEKGELTLEDALKQFEEGIRLARQCEKALSEAERKIEILLKNEEGEIEAQPFELSEADNGEWMSSPRQTTSEKPAQSKTKKPSNKEIPQETDINEDLPF